MRLTLRCPQTLHQAHYIQSIKSPMKSQYWRGDTQSEPIGPHPGSVGFVTLVLLSTLLCKQNLPVLGGRHQAWVRQINLNVCQVQARFVFSLWLGRVWTEKCGVSCFLASVTNNKMNYIHLIYTLAPRCWTELCFSLWRDFRDNLLF